MKTIFTFKIIELAYFVIILLLIIFGFGIVIQALMYHNQEFNAQLLETVFFTSYLVLAGGNNIAYILLNGNLYNLRITTVDSHLKEGSTDISFRIICCKLHKLCLNVSWDNFEQQISTNRT